MGLLKIMELTAGQAVLAPENSKIGYLVPRNLDLTRLVIGFFFLFLFFLFLFGGLSLDEHVSAIVCCVPSIALLAARSLHHQRCISGVTRDKTPCKIGTVKRLILGRDAALHPVLIVGCAEANM